MVHRAKHNSQPAWHCKNQEEQIILFKKRGAAVIVMILMKIPHKAMHNVFMRKPGYEFHQGKGDKNDDQADCHTNITAGFENCLMQQVQGYKKHQLCNVKHPGSRITVPR